MTPRDPSVTVESHAVPAWLAEVLAHRPAEARPSARRALPPSSADIDMGALLRFKSMMALEHQPVQVARMCYDRRYAYERIATAHASARDPLRRLALELFQAYHRRELVARATAAG
ncbi:hypothetical protein KGA65_00080 [Ideonella sp. B7]|uniref:hypothetical protein n=1 Tax=Ideonella benzenivorans TaxID=2831643 RepID=UPI001CECE0DF|nr:hypothetical protein [Ideonella benzenivorans]MCA6214931.1 hypothetical protein [Ideonella benzenivorans]